MLTIWGRRTSSNVQAVMWCVAELGLEHRRLDVGHRYGGTDTAEFIAMNPNRTVPVLRDGDGPALWESAAILRYLGRRYAGGGPLWPADPDRLTEVDRWAEWAKINVAIGFTGPVFWPMVRLPAKQRDPAAIARALKAVEAKLAIADGVLAGRAWLAGGEFSIADIQFGHVLYRYYDLDFDTVDLARADLPALRGYYDRLVERPAYRDHVMVSYEELRAGAA